MIVWGGADVHIQGRTVFMNDGAAYDPATDAWTPISSAGAPSPRCAHAGVWTGSVMLVWGGDSSVEFPDTPLGDGAAYDPATDTWHPIATANAPPACNHPTAVWTGSTMLVWGCGGGGEYDPVTDTWRRISDYGAPGGVAHTAVWSGSAMLTWTGLNGPSGGVYDPLTDTWKRMPAEGSPGQRINHYAVWTGTELLIFGGDDGYGNPYTGGALFTP
jgi:N-acetylneuraminic acid mutarotase